MDRPAERSIDPKPLMGDRRNRLRRSKDQAPRQSQDQQARKLQALLDLGRIIGLDLQIDNMLYRIAQKTAQVMEADRCSVFLYDAKTDELWSKVALGIEGKVIRIPSQGGIAGYCFRSRQPLNLKDAYEDPRFNREVDASTGYRTRSLLCLPLVTRSQQILGVIQVLNKREGVFTEEDQSFLKTFANQAAVFLEMAQLQTARIEALEQSREELRRLNLAKDKALDHLSHELRTPLSIIQGNLRLLKRKIEKFPELGLKGGLFEPLDKNLNRLMEIQQETDKIIRSSHEFKKGFILGELDRLLVKLEEELDLSPEIRYHSAGLKDWIRSSAPARPLPFERIFLYPFIEEIMKQVRERSRHRNLTFDLTGDKETHLPMEPLVLKEALENLLKNAVENTPDQGCIEVRLEKKEDRLELKVRDFGIGISAENQRYLFDGLFHTQDTELYASKKPYDFNAGGKGLGLLQTRLYSRRFGFELSVESRRCSFIPKDSDLCPGDISRCPHCNSVDDCLNSGGSTFCLSFPVSGGKAFDAAGIV